MKSLPKGELPVTPALVCLLFGSLLDAICTLVLLQLYGADEMNPLLAHAYRISPLAFMAVKMSFVFVSVLATCFVPMTAKRWIMRFGALVFMLVLAYQAVLLVSVWS